MQLRFEYGPKNKMEQIVLDVEVETDTAAGKIWRVRLPDGTVHRICSEYRPNDVLQIIEFVEVVNIDEVVKIDEVVENRVESEETDGTFEKTFLLLRQQAFRVPFARSQSAPGHSFSWEFSFEFSFEGMTYAFRTPAPPVTGRASVERKVEEGAGLLTAPMAGVIADILVAEGQAVAAYQPLVVIEAMKVMTTLEAPFAGVVKRLHVQRNQQVAHDAPVVEVIPVVPAEPSETASETAKENRP